MIVFMALFAVLGMYRAKKTRNNVFYMVSGFCLSLVVAFLVGVLGQYLLCLIIMTVSTIISVIVMYPRLMQTRADEFIKEIEKLDTLGPIRFKDIFSLSFIIKLERDYGIYKAMVICATVCAGLFSVFMFLMYLLGFMTLPMVGAFTVVMFIVSCVLYWQIREGRMPGRLSWMAP